MAEPTLASIFGAGATQDPTSITILKADLAAKGLVPVAANKAEGLLVAIVLIAADGLTPASLAANPDQNVSVEKGFESLETRGDRTYRQTTFNINLQKAAPSTPISADDY